MEVNFDVGRVWDAANQFLTAMRPVLSAARQVVSSPLVLVPVGLWVLAKAVRWAKDWL